MRRTRDAASEVALEDSVPRLLKFVLALDAYEVMMASIHSLSLLMPMK